MNQNFNNRQKKPEKILTAANINENMKKCQYDVRGEIYLAAVKRTNAGKEVIYTNVGNPQALGQVSFFPNLSPCMAFSYDSFF